MQATEMQTWRERLARNADVADVTQRQVLRAIMDQTGMRVGSLGEYMPQFVGLGDAPDGHDNGDSGLPLLVDDQLSLLGITADPDLPDWQNNEQTIWDWQELVSIGKVGVFPVTNEIVAYFLHPWHAEELGVI